MAELLANPVPPPPEQPLATDVASAVPPHMIDGVHITIQDLMVTDNEDALKDKDLSAWLDERENPGFRKMTDTKTTGLASIDEGAYLGEKIQDRQGRVEVSWQRDHAVVYLHGLLRYPGMRSPYHLPRLSRWWGRWVKV